MLSTLAILLGHLLVDERLEIRSAITFDLAVR